MVEDVDFKESQVERDPEETHHGPGVQVHEQPPSKGRHHFADLVNQFRFVKQQLSNLLSSEAVEERQVAWLHPMPECRDSIGHERRSNLETFFISVNESEHNIILEPVVDLLVPLARQSLHGLNPGAPPHLNHSDCVEALGPLSALSVRVSWFVAHSTDDHLRLHKHKH